MNKIMTQYTQHPIGKIMPAMDKSGNDYKEFERDIITNGLKQPIVIYQNQILDGWHRYNVCVSNSITPSFKTYEGENPVSDVISLNLHRRQLTAGQKACLAVEILPLIEAETKKNKRYVSTQMHTSVSSSLTDKSKEHSKSRYKAAKLTGTSNNSVQLVKKLKKEEPELYDKVKSGGYTIEDAKRNIKTKKLEAKKLEIIETSKNSISDTNRPVVYNADCSDWFNTIKVQSVDLLITDPPYSTDIDNISAFVKHWLPTALSKIKDTGRAYICTGAYPIEVKAYLDVLLGQKRFIVDNPLVWTYRNTLGVTPANKYNLNYQLIWHLYTTQTPELDKSITNEMFSVQDINAPDGRQGDRLHTWQKPTELARRLITHGSKIGDTIIDPFTCTGTFILEAARLGRIASGCDISAENLAIAIKRGCVCH